MTEPISTSPPPLGYLVSACMDTSTPKSNGLKATPAPHVLSSAVMMLRPAPNAALPSLALATTCVKAGRSGNSRVTEPGASNQTKRVLGVMRAAKSAGCCASKNSHCTPHFSNSTQAKSLPGPYAFSGIRTWSPVCNNAKSTNAMAAKPLGTKMQ